MSTLSKSQGDRGPGVVTLVRKHLVSEWQLSLRSQACPASPSASFARGAASSDG